MNHFEVFEIVPLRLDLDRNELERKFHELSRQHHPDHHGESSKALAEISTINGAYRILRDPWSRAGYLLEILNIPLGTKVPACLGSIYFELQETGDLPALKSLREQLMEDNKKRARQLTESFKSFDALKLRADNLDPRPASALLVLNKLAGLVLENRYALSMQRDIDAKIAQAEAA